MGTAGRAAPRCPRVQASDRDRSRGSGRALAAPPPNAAARGSPGSAPPRQRAAARTKAAVGGGAARAPREAARLLPVLPGLGRAGRGETAFTAPPRRRGAELQRQRQRQKRCWSRGARAARRWSCMYAGGAAAEEEDGRAQARRPGGCRAGGKRRAPARPPGRAGSGRESDGLLRGRLSAAARSSGRRLWAARGSARPAPGCRPEPCRADCQGREGAAAQVG